MVMWYEFDLIVIDTQYIYTYYIGYIGIWSFTHINMDTEHMHTEMNAYLPMPSEWSAGHRFPWRTSGSRHGDEGVRKWGEYGINGDIAKDITGIYIIIIMYIYILLIYNYVGQDIGSRYIYTHIQFEIARMDILVPYLQDLRARPYLTIMLKAVLLYPKCCGNAVNPAVNTYLG